MSSEELENAELYSTDHGPVEGINIQRVISSFENPGAIYLPSGTWEESLIVTQHNLTIIGDGEDTILEGEPGQSPLKIIAPNVRLIDLTIRSESDVPAISLSHGDATQAVFQNVTIEESGSHGIHRAESYGFALGAIINCNFKNIEGNAINAPSGTGPRNIVVGNEGHDIEEDFIRWGVDFSILMDNDGGDARIHLTEESKRNMVFNDTDTEIDDDGTNNLLY